MCRERERDREGNKCVFTCTYAYAYIYIYIFIYGHEACGESGGHFHLFDKMGFPLPVDVDGENTFMLELGDATSLLQLWNANPIF